MNRTSFRTSKSLLPSAILILAILFVLAVVATPAMQAQTYTVLYNFSGGSDGGGPNGLTMDQSGNFYGTASVGGRTDNGCDRTGYHGCGTVFRFSNKDSHWGLASLHGFTGSPDGVNPQARVIIGPDGDLYGTTTWGGTMGAGTVFKLMPGSGPSKPWVEIMVYQFSGSLDGSMPLYGDLLFDEAGDIYGTTVAGGVHGQGVVYKLTPTPSGWTESVLYSFTGGSDGGSPTGGLVRDAAGNLYGTARSGGHSNGRNCYGGCGTVFELTPSGGQWSVKVLHTFLGGADGMWPDSNLTLDQTGNVYGTTWGPYAGEYPNGATVVFMLSPEGGNWTFRAIHEFYAVGGLGCCLIFDPAGNLYGTTRQGGCCGGGTVFELTPRSDGSWTYSTLHDFNNMFEGLEPVSVVIDKNGNLVGTASIGGAGQYNWGVIFQISP